MNCDVGGIKYGLLKSHLKICSKIEKIALCNGCETFISTTNEKKALMDHLSTCSEIEIKFIQPGCPYSFRRRLMNIHIKNCEYVLEKKEKESTRWSLKYLFNDQMSCISEISQLISNKPRLLIAGGCCDGKIMVWNLKDHNCLVTLNRHRLPILKIYQIKLNEKKVSFISSCKDMINI